MKNIFFNYIKDRISVSILFVLNSILIIGFYYVTLQETVEVVYPMTISIFLLAIFLIIDSVRYIRFNRDIKGIKEDRNNNVKASTLEQQQVVEVIKSINLNNLKKENEILNGYKEKEHFLANAIHKFKNNISVIGLIIEKNKLNKEISLDALIEIEKENDNLYSSLEQVLSYIRTDNFGNDLELENIDIAKEVKTIINNNRSLWINNEVFPIYDVKDREIIITTDKKWNRIVIDQIISNSIKYSSGIEGEKKVKFSIESNDGNIYLKIKDNGIGIPKHDIKRIFDPFFTGENGRTIRSSTGIGLFIAKDICKRLRQDITIESKDRKGTVVTIKYLSKL